MDLAAVEGTGEEALWYTVLDIFGFTVLFGWVVVLMLGFMVVFGLIALELLIGGKLVLALMLELLGFMLEVLGVMVGWLVPTVVGLGFMIAAVEVIFFWPKNKCLSNDNVLVLFVRS